MKQVYRAMRRYEWKKLFASWGKKAALVLMALVVVNCCYQTTYYGCFTTEDGTLLRGFDAVQPVREAQHAWAGPLDEEKLLTAFQENQRIRATPEYQANSQNDIGLGMMMGIDDIRYCFRAFLSDDLMTHDRRVLDTLTQEDLPRFYENRVALLEKWFADQERQGDPWPENKQEFLLERYRSLETPLYYDYFRGWDKIFEYAPTIIGVFPLILGYLVAGIFADERRWKSDDIYFSSLHGRNLATRAKIEAGFQLVTVTYWLGMGIFSLYTLILFGFDGWNCPIQVAYFGFRSFYHLNMLQQYLLTLFGGYLGNLFSAFLVMWVSAKLNSKRFAVTIPFLISFLPNFFQDFKHDWVGHIMGILPDKLLLIPSMLQRFNVYGFGDHLVGAVPLLFVVYGILTVVLIPLMYRTFSRKTNIA